MGIDLSEFQGTFTDGWTDDDIVSVLPQINEKLGAEIVCVWEYVDAYGCGGHSELVVRDGALVREIPGGLWDVLVEATATSIAPFVVTDLPVHTEISTLDDFDQSGSFGVNFVQETRD